MADTAAHLVDRALSEAPVLQWVLSVPFALRYRLACDAQRTSAALSLFVRTVFASLRRRARQQWGIDRGPCGAVTFVQRFGDGLNVNVPVHSLALDGVYEPGAGQAPRFLPLPAPNDADVARVAGQMARRPCRLPEREGLGPEADAGAAPASRDCAASSSARPGSRSSARASACWRASTASPCWCSRRTRSPRPSIPS